MLFFTTLILCDGGSFFDCNWTNMQIMFPSKLLMIMLAAVLVEENGPKKQ